MGSLVVLMSCGDIGEGRIGAPRETAGVPSGSGDPRDEGRADDEPLCGNGVADAGESCDPPGSCPTSCDDGNACTDDSLSGSAVTCNVACSATVIEVCANDDGCCPVGCDSSSDNDCSADCGNGIVEPNETCDPPASCQPSCDDGDACTVDVRTGSEFNCNVACSYTNVRTCIDDDGCCPTPCTADSDSDCVPMCGNGVVEPGETCDPAATCPSSCSDGDPCTDDVLLGSATHCDAECSFPSIRACSANDGCCPSGCSEAEDSDCTGMSMCGGAGPATTPLDSEERSFLDLLNAHRLANGRSPVTSCTSLNRAAQGHSEDMRDQNYFDHDGLNGSSPISRACDACYDSCESAAWGENIAAGNSGAQGTFNQWVNSPGHNANMLGSSFVVVGIGRATGGGTYGVYWTTVFGGRSDGSCD